MCPCIFHKCIAWRVVASELKPVEMSVCVCTGWLRFATSEQGVRDPVGSDALVLALSLPKTTVSLHSEFSVQSSNHMFLVNGSGSRVRTSHTVYFGLRSLGPLNERTVSHAPATEPRRIGRQRNDSQLDTPACHTTSK